MRVAIFGTGYVGLVTGTCLAEVGHHVVCVDIDQAKVDGLNKGVVPIYEPGLSPMVKANHAARRLFFTTDAASAIAHGDIVFIAVGTPPDEDGSADLQYVLAVARTIGQHIQGPTVVVNKSTVPVGTADKVRAAIAAELDKRGESIEFDVVSNPEFLKEGDAVADCMRPDRIVIGSSKPGTAARLRRLYAPFNRNHDRIVEMDVRSAELTKYAANAMLATKISFMNEIANIAERVGADVEKVRQGIGSDPRIGWHFIYPGAGYGGSCFPKDVQALARTAHQYGHEAKLLDAVEAVNEAQKGHLYELIQRHYGGQSVAGKTFAVWGLAFKPNTDDMRAASSRRLLAQLWEAGATVRAYDPEATEEAKRIFGERDDLSFCEDAFAALEGADALVVVTEWKQFRSPDFTRIKELLGDAVVFDGRNLYDPQEIETFGLAYYGIGRGRSISEA
ncbi:MULTISPECIES: UDP-glucose dehydrogenase family protein [Xanthomonas translucens group]|uniref:UDP-glucose 6-dehydrogenase n=1 Tax=Xanthomonas cerealis pv. cerealis TaxID=152263 RepID=A0A514EB34_9XANT|nr:UDP-glucose/GDP-mannose dehydrogenase family protein [Xanthomonas translucens]QDI03268.1 UDP-glucose/GDP-mannose dehydrogenase family protein [Xanthomonas translucens pv. cerealis]UKE45770.1 UDP-glucose/GDP-mannose dehydrogenase family protein [Xanthomonas translucens pv. cerealis]UKE71117.1 UDP-glucose/GDP-mannose dehydrogenase family protein [Xanthomonas translucens pv. pistacia]